MNRYFLRIFLLSLISINIHADVWNSPQNSEKIEKEVYFSSFSLPYKHLDPVISYSKRESMILGQIYEPVVDYNYLKRPYVLEPLTLKEMPKIIYLDKNRNEVSEESEEVAFSHYTFLLREDIFYQNHPSLSKKYFELSEQELVKIRTLDDFEEHGTRKLTAYDYSYAIKRMAVRQNNSPILDIIQEYLVGLEEFSK